MTTIKYLAECEGDFARVHRYEDGERVGDPVLAGGRALAQRLTRELNLAVEAGRREAAGQLGTIKELADQLAYALPSDLPELDEIRALAGGRQGT